MLYRNPAKKVTIKGTDRKLAEKKFIEGKEMEQLAEVAKQWVEDDYLQLFVLTRLLYYTGMRIGEATALNVDDIDPSISALFVNKLGNRIDPHMYRYNLRKLCKDNGIIPHYTPHMFRHTHTVMLVESGATLKFIAQRLGDTTQTISKVYDHVSDKVERMNVEKLEALINNSNTSSSWAIKNTKPSDGLVSIFSISLTALDKIKFNI